MATQVMFGKTAASAPVRRAPSTPPPVQKVYNPEPVEQPENPYAGRDNLNELDFGRTFASKYCEDCNTFVIFVLWLFFGSFGGHRMYMGHKWLASSIAALGTFNGMLFFTGGITAFMSYRAGTGVISGGLISYFVVMAIHFSWVFFDFFYILVRKFTSR